MVPFGCADFSPMHTIARFPPLSPPFSFLPLPSTPHTPRYAMSYFNFSENLSVLQLFRSKDGQPLGGLSTDVSEHTNERYVLWSNVENSFPDKSHIQDENDSRILFMTDNDYRMYVNLLLRL